jgi:hypothetical protein
MPIEDETSSREAVPGASAAGEEGGDPACFSRARDPVDWTAISADYGARRTDTAGLNEPQLARRRGACPLRRDCPVIAGLARGEGCPSAVSPGRWCRGAISPRRCERTRHLAALQRSLRLSPASVPRGRAGGDSGGRAAVLATAPSGYRAGRAHFGQARFRQVLRLAVREAPRQVLRRGGAQRAGRLLRCLGLRFFDQRQDLVRRDALAAVEDLPELAQLSPRGAGW